MAGRLQQGIVGWIAVACPAAPAARAADAPAHDGIRHMPAFDLPLSSFLSAQAQATAREAMAHGDPLANATRRFEVDADANAQLANTVRLDTVSQADFDTVFYPGGHGPL